MCFRCTAAGGARRSVRERGRCGGSEYGGAPAEVYRRYLERRELGLQRCRDCGEAVFYPRVVCPACGGGALAWEMSGGRGTVYATTAIHRRNGEPYNVALVDLDEGFRMMSRIEGINAEEVAIGQRVTFAVREEDDGPVVVFLLEEEGS